MNLSVSLLQRTHRLLIAGLVTFASLGTVYVADASVLYATTGSPGPLEIVDTAGAPGAYCEYNSSGLLYDITVIRPRIYARANYAQQPVSFRARVQWLYSDLRQDTVDSGAAQYVNSPVSQAIGKNYASLEHLHLPVRLSPTATLHAYVDEVAEWRNPRTNAVEGARAYYITYYRQVQTRSDGTRVVVGNVTASTGCPARVS
jgi:hypothetical protein